MQHADGPGPLDPEIGRRERVDADEDAVLPRMAPRFEQRLDRGVIGPVIVVDAELPLRLGQVAIAGISVASDSVQINSGVSSDRLGSITSREKVDSTSGASSCSESTRLTARAPGSQAMWLTRSRSVSPSVPKRGGSRLLA